MTTSVPVSRPVGVTLVVILTWISAIVSVAFGIFLILEANNPTVIAELSGKEANVRLVGISSVIIGVLIGLIAMGLAKGSNFLRILVSLLLVLRIIGDVIVLSGAGGRYLGPTLVSIVIALVLLAMLWTSKASAFFKQ